MPHTPCFMLYALCSLPYALSSMLYYILTPKGINERVRLTSNFLKRKLEEYDRLEQEIKDLKSEIENNER